MTPRIRVLVADDHVAAMLHAPAGRIELVAHVVAPLAACTTAVDEPPLPAVPAAQAPT